MRKYLWFTLIIITLMSCTNNRFDSISPLVKKTSTTPLDRIIIPVEETPIILTRVLRNATSPTSTFDLIGDGTGAMGKGCMSKDTENSTQSKGESTCTCAYSYTLSNGSTESYEAPTTYHEGNVIRCLYVDIPTAVKSVKVRIHQTTLDTYSNSISFNLNNRNITLDPTEASTFAQVQRYQCRDLLWIPNSLAPDTIYDPFQSEDPHNSIPMNFYTTNLGASQAIYGGGMSSVTPPKNWNCPSIPNDPHLKMDLTLYSAGPDSAGSKKIYPPSGSSFDRSTFYLARRATSVFDVPVNAYIAPEINTLSPDAQGNQTAGAPPIGYGASPISTGIPGQETCPDLSIAKPTGYHWVKVWLYRMAMPGRKAIYSYYFNNIGPIACSPGDWKQTTSLQRNAAGNIISSHLNSVFPDCDNNTNSSITVNGPSRYSESLSLTDLMIPEIKATGAQLASRVFTNYNSCFNVDPVFHLDLALPLLVTPIPKSDIYATLPASLPTPTVPSPSPAPTLPAEGAKNTGYSNGPGKGSTLFSDFGLGTDLWNQNLKYSVHLGITQVERVDPYTGCWGSGNIDPAHLCTSVFDRANKVGDGSAPPQPFYPIPYDNNPGTLDIDNPSSPRYDYLFVVTPTNVMSGQITNPSSNEYQTYTPYRFMSLEDCQSPDPDNPNSANDCNSQHALRNYGIKFHDVSSAGDPPANDPQRSGIFPICALQPD